MKVKKKAFFWLPPITWMALIFLLSSFPKLQISEGLADFVLRKLAHMFEYGVLFVLLFLAFKKTTSLAKRKALWLSFLLTVLYAASDEYHQTFVPGRHGCLSDVSIDTLGAVAGVVFVQKLVFLLPKKARSIILGREEEKQ